MGIEAGSGVMSNAAAIASQAQWERQACIFKTHDDCRQDALCLQIIELLRDIFENAGLEIYLYPYRVIATRCGKNRIIGGMIEMVPDSSSRDELGKENNLELKDYFISKYGNEESSSFKRAQRNFILSMAGYAVVCYLLQIKDRHNANIMILGCFFSLFFPFFLNFF